MILKVFFCIILYYFRSMYRQGHTNYYTTMNFEKFFLLVTIAIAQIFVNGAICEEIQFQPAPCETIFILISCSATNTHRINFCDFTGHKIIIIFPVFDEGENLSFQWCGLWMELNNSAPWRATIGKLCPGILVSAYSILSGS